MHHPAPAALLQAARILDAFTLWLTRSGDDLVDAAELLGGAKGVQITNRVLAATAAGHDLATVLPDLRRLKRLLHLELIADLNSEEAIRFMSIHPDDPRADNARICAEAVGRGIRALETVTSVGTVEAA